MTKSLKPLKHENVKLLIVHCSGSRCNQPFTLEGLIATGNARFGQPSYHYYVRRNGEVYPILPENVRGAHAKHYNHCSLGICYEGGYDKKGRATDTRTEKQKHALFELLKDLHYEYPNARIMGHCELPGVAKPCPCYSMAEYSSLQPDAVNQY